MVAVVVVEDDLEIRFLLTQTLRGLGHEVRAVADGSSALTEILNDPPEVVLLDLGLPDLDGSTLLTMVRAVTRARVIVLTARTETEEIVRLLNLGADDYVTKPFEVNQLEARIRAVARRSDLDADSCRPLPMTIGELEINFSTRTLARNGQPIILRHLEFELLKMLALAQGHLVTSEALIAGLWGAGVTPTDGAARLDVQLSLLRSKLGESAREPRYIHRVRGMGIRLATG